MFIYFLPEPNAFATQFAWKLATQATPLSKMFTFGAVSQHIKQAMFEQLRLHRRDDFQ
jgi:hypothetical protein